MNFIGGILVLTVTAGLGISSFSEEDTSKEEQVVQEHCVKNNESVTMMGTEDYQHMEEGIVNFGQMKSHMSEMHPELNNQELRDHYKAMHGTGGSSRSTNFRGMGSMH